MKIATYSIFLIFLLQCSFSGHTQNNTIDSLQKVLKTQKEDTNKVNTLNELCNELRFINDFKNSLQCAEEAISLAENLM